MRERSFEDVEKQLKLIDLISELFDGSPYDRIYSLLEIVRIITGMRRVRLYTSAGNMLHCVAAVPKRDEERLTNILVPNSYWYVQQTLKTQKPVIVTGDAAAEDKVASVIGQKWFGLIALNIGNGDWLLSVDDENEPDEKVLYKTLLTVKRLVERVFANAETMRMLKNMAVRDRLTGLFNRQYLESRMLDVLEDAARKGYPVSFAMIDLDGVKKINDTEGHYVTDRILERLGNMFKQFADTHNIDVCRYGGDEFYVIMPGFEKSSALRLIDRLRRSVAEETFMVDGKQLTVTLSAGLLSFQPADRLRISMVTEGVGRELVEDIIKKTDSALYEAKKTKNRVVTYTPR